MTLRALALVLLAVVVLSPPLAMVSNNCAAMGADCEGPCGTVIAVTASAPDRVSAPGPVSTLEFLSGPARPMLSLGVLEPPPRS